MLLVPPDRRSFGAEHHLRLEAIRFRLTIQEVRHKFDTISRFDQNPANYWPLFDDILSRSSTTHYCPPTVASLASDDRVLHDRDISALSHSHLTSNKLEDWGRWCQRPPISYLHALNTMALPKLLCETLRAFLYCESYQSQPAAIISSSTFNQRIPDLFPTLFQPYCCLSVSQKYHLHDMP
jgi:hypothetical protein